jgi:hypothetical protein
MYRRRGMASLNFSVKALEQRRVAMTAARRHGRRMGLLLRPGHGNQSNQSIHHTIILFVNNS